MGVRGEMCGGNSAETELRGCWPGPRCGLWGCAADMKPGSEVPGGEKVNVRWSAEAQVSQVGFSILLEVSLSKKMPLWRVLNDLKKRRILHSSRTPWGTQNRQDSRWSELADTTCVHGRCCRYSEPHWNLHLTVSGFADWAAGTGRRKYRAGDGGSSSSTEIIPAPCWPAASSPPTTDTVPQSRPRGRSPGSGASGNVTPAHRPHLRALHGFGGRHSFLFLE